jgi:glycosyltransferase involved in cell wall biosynthesis
MPSSTLAVERPALNVQRSTLENWPRFTIVTPSYNQGQYLEETICSVLDQGYPNLEYIIIDGGSTDNSVAIIERYAPYLAYWVSEPDRGQYHGLNKGFSRATGELMGWINSDDKHLPWTLRTAATIFATDARVRWLTTATLLRWNRHGDLVGARTSPGYARTWFYRGWNLKGQPGFQQWIQQESTFWRRQLWEEAGGSLDDRLAYAGDFELWARFWEHTDLVATSCPLAAFRVQPEQKTAQLDAYCHEAEQVLAPYRRRTVQPAGGPLQNIIYWLQRQLLRWTSRGGERFGSRLARAEYDFYLDTWYYSHVHVI